MEPNVNSNWKENLRSLFQRALTANGTAGNLITIESFVPGQYGVFSCSSGVVDVTYVNLTDSHATGGATFNSLIANGCVDSGGNTGWNFT